VLGHPDDLGGKLERGDDKKGFPIGTDDQEIVAPQPIVQTIESVPPALSLAAQITAKRGYTNVATETPARGTGKRHALSGQAMVLQQAHDGTLSAVSFIEGSAAAGHGTASNCSRS
jgi:hypothetical protein